jgi:PHS family inorganic phosphate transporter-like MFS transporter
MGVGGGGSLWVSALANFHVQYNFQVIALAESVMKEHYKLPPWGKTALAAIIFAGAITGQLSFGYIGDRIGRNKAMTLTNLLTVIGALGSAVLSWGSADHIYLAIVLCRFLLGVGVGGVYPLSAVKAAEEAVNADVKTRTKRVAWAFFWQTPGTMAPAIVTLIIVSITGNVDVRFRLILGLGAIPAFICWLATRSQAESQEFQSTNVARKKPIVSMYSDKRLWLALLGTGGSWFLYDVCYYGTALFAPDILEDILGKEDDIIEIAWHTLVSNAMGLPGVLATIFILSRYSLRNIQIAGFILAAVAYTALAFEFQYARHNKGLLFTTFCFLTFTLNFGPNVTTFVLPQETFPVEVRSTFNGFSAALAKLGAVVGVVVYGPLAEIMGLPLTLVVCAIVSLLGGVITYFFINDQVKMDDKQLSLLAEPSLEPRSDAQFEATVSRP